MTFVDGDQLGLFGAVVAGEHDDGTREPATVGAWPNDCRNAGGIRPCPIVSCRHHLLLDEVYSGAGAPGLAINRAGSLVQLRGRRKELAPDATRADVDAFADDAVAALWRLPDTCSREVARRARLRDPDADEVMTFEELAIPLGVADPDELAEECADILDGIRGELYAAGVEHDGDALRATIAWTTATLAARRRLAAWWGCEVGEVEARIDQVLARGAR